MDYKNRYDSLIEWAWQEKTRLIEPDPATWRLLKAQVKQESNFKPDAISSAGAGGLLQLMPATAQLLGLSVSPCDERMNPEKCLIAGAAFLADSWRIWHQEVGIERWKFALGSYNAGSRNILDAQARAQAAGRPTDQWIEIAQQLPFITGHHSEETVDYVRSIIGQFLAWSG